MTSKQFKQMLKKVARKQTDQLSLRHILRESDALDLMLALVDFGNWPACELEAELSRATEERQIVLLVDAFTRVTDAGGMEQLVTDPVLGGRFVELSDCFKAIGATSALAYLKKVKAFFPECSIPTDEFERFEMLQTIKRQLNLPNFRTLDREFANVATETIEALRQHIVKDTARFEKALSFEGRNETA